MFMEALSALNVQNISLAITIKHRRCRPIHHAPRISHAPRIGHVPRICHAPHTSLKSVTSLTSVTSLA